MLAVRFKEEVEGQTDDLGLEGMSLRCRRWALTRHPSVEPDNLKSRADFASALQ